MVKVLITLVRITNRQALRYPLEALVRVLGALVFFTALAFAVQKTTKAELADALLGSMITMLALVAMTRTANLGEGESREEAFLYPYPVWSFQLARAFAVSALVNLGLITLYGFLAGSLAEAAHGFLLILIGYLGAVGIGLFLLALNLLFVKTELITNLAALGVLTLAFMPLGKAPEWVTWAPVANAVQLAQGQGTITSALVLANLGALLAGVLAVRRAERVVVERGIAGLA